MIYQSGITKGVYLINLKLKNIPPFSKDYSLNLSILLSEGKRN